ncbi:MAG: peptidoglycan editing factor PgeF [Nitrospirae bacterium]|nr:peptidoglycan editing factor PgeF [Nitrospirota bacterium]
MPIDYIIYPEIFGKGVKAFFTGKSPGAHIGRIAEIASVSKDNIYFPKQLHTGKVIELKMDMTPQVADAVITGRKDVLIGIQTADCVPILIYSRDSNLIAAVHAGWRGTVKGILKKTLRKMLNSSKSDNILMAIGPAIRGCCYKVGLDVLQAVIKETGKGDYYTQRNGANRLDLSYANMYQAMSMGISKENIWMSDECTYCSSERFYSYRKTKGTTGRQGGFIGIRS